MSETLITRIAIVTGNEEPSLTGGLSRGLTSFSTASGGEPSAMASEWQQLSNAIAIAIPAVACPATKLLIYRHSPEGFPFDSLQRGNEASILL